MKEHATETHQTVFSRYLRDAHRTTRRDGTTKMEEWALWLSRREIMRCSYCGKYGREGHQVYHQGTDERRFQACVTGLCRVKAHAEARDYRAEERKVEVGDGGRALTAIRVTARDPDDDYCIDYSATDMHTPHERALLAICSDLSPAQLGIEVPSLDL